MNSPPAYGKEAPAKPTSKKRGGLWWALILVLVTGLWLGLGKFGRAIEVEVLSIERKDLEADFTAEGYVRGKSFEVSPEVGGRVVRLLVREGQPVRAGELVAEIDSQEIDQAITKARAARSGALIQVSQALLEWQQADRDAKAAIASARERVNQAEAGLKRASVGPRQEEIHIAAKRIESAQAVYDNAIKSFRRTETLVREGALAQAALDEAESRLKTSRADLLSAQESLNLLRKSPIAEDIAIAKSTVQTARADLDAAIKAQGVIGVRRTSIELAKSQEKAAESDLARAELQRQKTRLYSPTEGVVSRCNIEQGMLATTGQSLLTVATRKDLHIEAEVDTEDVPKVTKGMKVRVTSAAYPSRNFSGHVDAIMATGELKPGSAIRTRIVRVRVSLDSESALFKPEMEVDVEGSAILRRAMTAPNDAVHFDGAQAYVWIVNGQTVGRRLVTIGVPSAKEVEIISGLQQGDRVVVRSQGELAVGARIREKS